ncbi:hypothetical protein POTOM_049582 [Populus tomentosa]|uniref:Uncharacterized protein n=1 Tax=Populus tomentosa TaxID=118781 RepID=A0A8X8C3F4_POPTO|nr:hypothetical protein POTOM_049582 [Populus tomentosa]
MTSHETDGGFMSDSRRGNFRGHGAGDTQGRSCFLIGNGIIKGHSSAEFTVVLGVRFDPTDLHRFEVEIQYRFTITCGQSEKTNVKSTTYKTQVQSPTGQGRSTLRYWAFSDSYPFQQ